MNEGIAVAPEKLMRRWTKAERELALDYLLDTAEVKSKRKPKLVHLAETVEAAEKLRQQGDEINGLSTGYKCVDEMTRGIRGSQVIVVFGDTGHRKSMFVQNVAFNVASAGTPVLFIGLEMANEENTERFLDMDGDGTLPIVYPESPDLDYKDIDPLVAEAASEGVGLVILDHLHMFAHDGENDASGITKICIEMKKVTRKYGIPMLLVSHINADKQRKGIPNLNDLKGSSSIKQIADKAIAVFSPGLEADLPDDEIVLKLQKSRIKRQQTSARLNIMPNGRLAEKKPLPIFTR